MIHRLFFSATNTTERIVSSIADEIGGESRSCDITLEPEQGISFDAPDDIVIIGTPVYAGRVPQLAAERLGRVRGNGQRAVVVCVYGNRDYDDALVELCDIAEARGFRPIAAGAFIAEHCIFPRVATSRPDASDWDKIRQFARLCTDRIAGKGTCDKSKIKGNRPYLKPAGVPIHPRADKDRCTECGVCARACPAGAIDRLKPYATDDSKCISCCRCIHLCPSEARHFGGLLYKIAGWKFTRDNARRLEPEWF